MKNIIPSSQITPKSDYINRRRFFKSSAQFALAAYLAASCAPNSASSDPTPTKPTPIPGKDEIDELGNPLTPYLDILSYTNFYEFSTAKSEPTKLAQNFQTNPWSVEIGGLVKNPMTLDLDKIRNQFVSEERIYRMRCVEAWSMVIPWSGFPLKELLDLVEPTAKAKYIRFETLFDPKKMPGQASPFFPWPYVEGLRIDEAMHDLTLLATGLYGEPLHPQNGAPIRLVVPWKYGFKSIKSIVRIDLVEEMPTSLWMASSPGEYGFFANVNPQVDHPRWSQGTERRIGTGERIETMLFNGYAEVVAYLYEGMDLSAYF